MDQFQSITHRLYSVFVFFLLVVLGFGVFSTDRLRSFNSISATVRDRWLPNTRLLGDLNNYTSDFRAAEGSTLAATTPKQFDAIEREVGSLDREITRSADGYEHLYHDPLEERDYQRYQMAWSYYRAMADRVIQLAKQHKRPEAATAYMTVSRSAYQRASDQLGHLTSRNVDNARLASVTAEAAYRDAVSLTTLAFILAAATVAVSIFYIRRSISQPLLSLAKCMRAVASNATDVEISGTERGDEVGEMARAVVIFKNNAIDLALSQKGLAEQASMLREKLEQERRLTILQRNFVSMASHEFRTPLAIIDAHAQRLIAVEKNLKPNEVSMRARKIRSSILRMTSLIDGLLGSSLLENKVELYCHPAPFDLAQIMEEVCHLHREISPRSQIYTRYAVNPVILRGDRKLLFQVFSNLLANAIKYSPGEGLITIRVERNDDSVEVIVKDNGIGIPEKDIAHLFDRYFRGSNVSGIVGTGVGLYFVKMVIELHGGAISVVSTEGEGATFRVNLPMAMADNVAAQTLISQDGSNNHLFAEQESHVQGPVT